MGLHWGAMGAAMGVQWSAMGLHWGTMGVAVLGVQWGLHWGAMRAALGVQWGCIGVQWGLQCWGCNGGCSGILQRNATSFAMDAFCKAFCNAIQPLLQWNAVPFAMGCNTFCNAMLFAVQYNPFCNRMQ